MSEPREVSERTRRIRAAQAGAEAITVEILARALADGTAYVVHCEPQRASRFVMRADDGSLVDLAPKDPDEWAGSHTMFEQGDALDVVLACDGRHAGRRWRVDWVHNTTICLTKEW